MPLVYPRYDQDSLGGGVCAVGDQLHHAFHFEAVHSQSWTHSQSWEEWQVRWGTWHWVGGVAIGIGLGMRCGIGWVAGKMRRRSSSFECMALVKVVGAWLGTLGCLLKWNISCRKEYLLAGIYTSPIIYWSQISMICFTCHCYDVLL